MGRILLLTRVRAWGRVCSGWLLLGVLIGAGVLFAQPSVDWTVTVGGPGDEMFLDVVAVGDSGFLLVGTTGSTPGGDMDVLLVRMLPTGDTLWTRRYGGPGDQVATAVQPTGNGWVVVGWSRVYPGYTDPYVLRLQPDGDTLWTHIYDANNTTSEEARSVKVAGDGGFWIGGTRSGTVRVLRVLRTDAQGQVLWASTYSGPTDAWLSDLHLTPDGGAMLLGNLSWSPGSSGIYLVRLASTGDTLFTRTYGSSGSDTGAALLADPSGGWTIAGSRTPGNTQPSQGLLMRVDTGGQLQWSQTVGGDSLDTFTDLLPLPSGGWVLCGRTRSWGAGEDDGFLARTDTSGIPVWTWTIGGSGQDRCTALAYAPDGSVLLAGTTQPAGSSTFDAWAVRLAPFYTARSESLPIASRRAFQIHLSRSDPRVLVLHLTRTRPVQIHLLDPAGRLRFKTSYGTLPPGVHRLSLSPYVRRAGVYRVWIQVGGTRVEHPLIVP